MSHIFLRVAHVLLAALLLSGGLAHAGFKGQVFQFEGVCLDCTAPDSSSPVITAWVDMSSNYVPGSAITQADVLYFQYGGSNLLPSFGIAGDYIVSVGGSLSTEPGTYDFFISGRVPGAAYDPQQNTGYDEFFFQTYMVGYWYAGVGLGDTNNDFGQPFSFNGQAPVNVPEPGGVALLGLGLVALAFCRKGRGSL